MLTSFLNENLLYDLQEVHFLSRSSSFYLHFLDAGPLSLHQDYPFEFVKIILTHDVNFL